ncbi:MAG: hypothetical protein N2049_10705 [Anaerolineales bacterium]|nr:hypothetical protein [Anaerolineales bacterium]MDW8227727.1 hypothetical protein [Anaerolineales bacterium]
MFITISVWLLITLLTGLYGIGLWQLFKRWSKEKDTSSPSWFFLLFSGLAILAFLGNLFSLFLRLHSLTMLLLLLGALAMSWFYRREIPLLLHQGFLRLKRTHWLFWLVGGVIVFISLLKTIGPPTNWDSGLYHAQAIRWMESYPTVPGLGNLLDELAFNSSWLTLNALFSFPYLFGQSLHGLTGWLFLVMSLFFLSKLPPLLEGKFSLSALAALLFLFLARRLLLWELSSPGTDAPATLMIWGLALISLESFEQTTVKKYAFLLTVLLAIFTITIKLSALPALLWILFIGFQIPRQDRKTTWTAATLAVFLFLLPWLARNVILSGYLVYPFPALDLFSFDWKVPPSAARDAAEWIRAWARLPGIDKELTLSYSLFEWLPLWYNHQQTFDLTILLASLTAFVLLLLSQPFAPKQVTPLQLTIGALVGVGFWFWQAPDFRFGYGFIGALLACSLAGLGAVMSRSISPRLMSKLALLALLVFIVYQMPKLTNADEILSSYPIRPADYPESDLELVQLNNFALYVPENYQCWYAPLPCSPYYPETLFLRSDSLSDGFKTGSP